MVLAVAGVGISLEQHRSGNTEAGNLPFYERLASARALDTRCHLLGAERRTALDARMNRVAAVLATLARRRNTPLRHIEQLSGIERDAAARAAEADCAAGAVAAGLTEVSEEVRAADMAEASIVFTAGRRLALRCNTLLPEERATLAEADVALERNAATNLPQRVLGFFRDQRAAAVQAKPDDVPCEVADRHLRPVLEQAEKLVGRAT